VSLFGKQKDARGGAGSMASAASAPHAARETARPTDTGRTTVKGGVEMANIGKSITIKGDLTGKEDLVIEGTVEGRVDLPEAQLTVGQTGTIQAEIHAKAIVVVGKVSGNIYGSDRIEIQSTGIVNGDVTAPRLIVAEGAVLNGAIQMNGKQSSGASGTPTSPGNPSGSEVRKVG